MFYFLPSWKQASQTTWDATPQPWYSAAHKIEFDDTVSQLRMLHEAQQQPKIVLTAYSPFLRTFLQQQKLLGVAYYSVFDDLQKTTTMPMRSLDFLDLNWPADIEFNYTPFLVIASLHDRLWARIEFGEGGRLLKIERPVNDQQTKTYFFDDRGFLSSIKFWDQARQRGSHKFLSSTGEVCLQLALPANTVRVKGALGLKQTEYPDLDSLIQERVSNYLSKTLTQNNFLMVAASTENLALLAAANLPRQRLGFSIFSNRLSFDLQTCQQLAKGKVWLADTDQNYQLLVAKAQGLPNPPQIRLMTPFDSRLNLGHSQQLKELKILWLFDGLSLPEQKQVFSVLLAQVAKNPAIQLTLATYRQLDQTKLATELGPLITQANLNDQVIFDFQKSASDEENDLTVSANQRLINCLPIKKETDLIKELSATRLIIDLAAKPSLFLQIAGISAGIPQINRVVTSYVQPQQNGLVIRSLTELTAAIDYYLVGLKHWNQALVYATERIAEFSSQKLLSIWQSLESK
ncbi:accessory Sec system protein Asp1 [Liquorilactobacillus sicerae]|uniref:accessory Sec system protein Asp1 n=1 Tax=Liquorilactobacillus sicerae TaxID=1416943 RepID=UPI00247FAAAF|nr:accessory Sec system protein Asp1 [Liquorilactobacillus sicerae]